MTIIKRDGPGVKNAKGVFKKNQIHAKSVTDGEDVKNGGGSR
jgi:hypothetical protein